MSRPQPGVRVRREGRRTELRVYSVHADGRELLVELVTGADWTRANRGEPVALHSTLYAADLALVGAHRWRERLVQAELELGSARAGKSALQEGR